MEWYSTTTIWDKWTGTFIGPLTTIIGRLWAAKVLRLSPRVILAKMPGTPILDLETDPPQPPAKWKLQLIGLALGSAIGFGITKLPIDPVTALLCLPAFYLAVAIHEIGHLIAGKLAGMDPGGLIVGGFAMFKSGERWMFRFDYRNIMCGGLAKPLPPNGEFSRAKFAWMVAGGPLGSLLFAAAMGAARLRYGSGPLAWRGSLFWTAVFIAIISLVLAVEELTRRTARASGCFSGIPTERVPGWPCS